MGKVRLLGGIEHGCDLCGEAGGILQISVTDSDVGTLAVEFSDPAHTQCITWVRDDGETPYVGYTRMTGLLQNGWTRGAVLISMVQGVSENGGA